jgi:type I restriction enzyme M protein
VSIDTGIEIGKMAYGTGNIPFIRTSDLSNWEIKTEFKHGVSADLYEQMKRHIDVQPDDILMVRDGTYLIGTTAIVTEDDVPMLFQSHIFRIRVLDSSVIDPWLLLVCLNMPVVKMQIRAKQFTQDIIDTLGQRVLELVIPIPKEIKIRESISADARELVKSRTKLREQARQLPLILQGVAIRTQEDTAEVP